VAGENGARTAAKVLFAGQWRHLESCSSCGLIFERNPGDTWAFTVIGDRLPIAPSSW
jgi:hypothetical protein